MSVSDLSGLALRATGLLPVKIATTPPMMSGMSITVARRAPYPVRAQHKQCGKCGKLVARAAMQCRRCGKRQRIRPRVLLLVGATVLMAAMFAVASAGTLFGSTRPAELAQTSPSAVQDGAGTPNAGKGRTGTGVNKAHALEMSAADLWMEYARDPAGADRRFRDRPVVVSGTVRSIERDFDGRLMVRLSTGDALDTVNAKLAIRNDPAIAGVSKGRPLALECVGRGALIGAPLLGSCSVL
jgi:hypothetical protein